MFILYFLLFLIICTALFGAISAAPWLPTKNKDIERTIGLAGIKKGDVVYDLGCGDGRLVFAAARLGAKAIGVEIFVLPYLFAKIKSFFVPGAKIIFGNFFKTNISDADVVFVFLLSKSYGRLMDKFRQELKSGTRIVVSCWPIKEWQPEIIDRPENQLPVYLYKYKN